MDHAATAGPLLRWVRALALAAVGLIAGVTFHVSADGLLPGPWALVAMLGLSTGGAAPFLGAPASTRRVVALLVVWQTLVHAALTAMSGHRGDPTEPHGDVPAPAGAFVSSRVHHLIEDMTAPHAAMAVGHLAAAVVAGLWLAAGERALWRLLTLAVRPVLSVADAVSALALTAGWSDDGLRDERPPATPDARRLSLWFLVRAVPRRGPPVAA